MIRSLKVTFKNGPVDVAEVHGNRTISDGDLSDFELSLIPVVEAFLEKLTGFRTHIETDTPEDLT